MNRSIIGSDRTKSWPSSTPTDSAKEASLAQLQRSDLLRCLLEIARRSTVEALKYAAAAEKLRGRHSAGMA